MEILNLIGNANVGANLLYIDPAATSVLLSSLAAIAVAVGATGIILWRKFRNKMKKIVKTDPNKNKEVEKEISLTNDALLNDEKAAAQAAEAQKPAEKVDVKADNKNEKKPAGTSEKKSDNKDEKKSDTKSNDKSHKKPSNKNE